MFKFAVLLSAVACASAMSLPLDTRQADTCARTYTVVSGDNCNAISAVQKVPTYQLALNNPRINANCSNIYAGQVLCLAQTGKDCRVTHVVKAGDGCWSIFTNLDIPEATFYANNPSVKADCSNIYPDQVLCAAKSVINYSEDGDCPPGANCFNKKQ
ncbi:hypothetical protein BDV98DRAFT_577369 [Pterulicium gracile]|uniref:LysM domain-containing protein n=1 Tax=Pterulicium gracile TaxID=1884261 RepID=A0A5C3Q1H8_9AGAR|nr:hypothetical protein BDV98DRAFT_577369 [Pterula gracilis]